jgi:hypothetical protein
MAQARGVGVYLIRDAEIADVYALARNLRDGDRLEVASLGFTPIQGLRRTFYSALYRRTALIDGEIAAMWGLSGTAFGHTGHPWLMTAPLIERLPVSFLREARREIGRMARTHRCLEGWVAAQYTMACRFLEALGFTLGAVEEIGPRKAKFRRFGMET